MGSIEILYSYLVMEVLKIYFCQDWFDLIFVLCCTFICKAEVLLLNKMTKTFGVQNIFGFLVEFVYILSKVYAVMS